MPSRRLETPAQAPPADACILQSERDGIVLGAQDIVQPSFDEGAQRGSVLDRRAFALSTKSSGSSKVVFTMGFRTPLGGHLTLFCGRG